MTLPLDMDPITRKKLVIVKQLYLHASIQASDKYSAVGQIMTIIGLDLAVETLLKVIVSSIDPKKTISSDFTALSQQLETLMRIETNNFNYILPDKQKISHIHSLRNDAQHKAKYPNTSDISDSNIYVRDFLHELVYQVWNINFNDITLTTLIQHDLIREFFIDAEAAFNINDYDNTIKHARTGLAWAIDKVSILSLNSYSASILQREIENTAQIYSTPRLRTKDNDVRGTISSMGNKIQSAFKSVYQAMNLMNKASERQFKIIEDTLIYFALGISYSDVVKMNRIAGIILIPNGKEKPGSVIFANPKKSSITKEEAQFVLSFCTNALIQIETQVGDLDNLL